MTEQEILNRFFNPQENPVVSGIILGPGDDCALLQPPPGYCLAVTTDTLVENVHFFKDTDPFHLGYKAIAVNLSDLAAMGAEPIWMLGNLSLPHAEESWLKSFSQGMFTALQTFHVALVGGNLTRGPLTITFTAFGLLPTGSGVHRQGATAGDYIAVTGCIGLAALAFYSQQSAQKEIDIPPLAWQRLHHPEPRVSTGMALRNVASSMIDLTDGLTRDCTRLLQASHLGGTIDLHRIPLPQTLSSVSESTLRQWIGFGDDYELCFTIPSLHVLKDQQGHLHSPLLDSIADATKVPIHIIGRTHHTANIQWVQPNGQLLDVSSLGFDHFFKT